MVTAHLRGHMHGEVKCVLFAVCANDAPSVSIVVIALSNVVRRDWAEV
jgi:hypothetical protein